MYYANNDILCIIFVAIVIAIVIYAYKLGEQEGYKKAREDQRRRKLIYNRHQSKR